MNLKPEGLKKKEMLICEDGRKIVIFSENGPSHYFEGFKGLFSRKWSTSSIKWLVVVL